MKHSLTILTGIFIAISCSNGARQNEKRELVPNPEKYVHDGYSEQPDSIKPQFKPDTSIGQISLISSKNVDSYLGKDVMERLTDKDLPSSSVISTDSKQRLTFYFHPGNEKKEFSEFIVGYVDQNDRNEFVTNNEEFVTESGIKLGMTMGDFRTIKGEPDSIANKETTNFHYRIDDFNNSEFLKRYNMPIYYAVYEFKNGYLCEIKFGFEYP
jgi:hypothetical protein